MNLTQQPVGQLESSLEDKKKGCGIIVNVDNSDKGFGGWQCGQYYDSFKRIYYCKRCSEIIAILEQAIAEMQKQRQEILDWIKEHEFTQNQGGYLIYADDLEVYIKQLNQPKTEE